MYISTHTELSHEEQRLSRNLTIPHASDCARLLHIGTPALQAVKMNPAGSDLLSTATFSEGISRTTKPARGTFKHGAILYSVNPPSSLSIGSSSQLRPNVPPSQPLPQHQRPPPPPQRHFSTNSLYLRREERTAERDTRWGERREHPPLSPSRHPPRASPLPEEAEVGLSRHRKSLRLSGVAACSGRPRQPPLQSWASPRSSTSRKRTRSAVGGRPGGAVGRRGAAGRGAGDERAAVCPQRAPPPQEPGLGLGGGPGCGTARRAGPVVRGLPRSPPSGAAQVGKGHIRETPSSEGRLVLVLPLEGLPPP